MKLFRDKIVIGLAIVLLLGAFLRFYKLDWGQGLFTHPDEYHIIISVNQLSFPDQMHPHFFNYGTVTIYLIYFTKKLLSFLLSSPLTLSPFLIGRFYSALFSTLTIALIYLISLIFLNKKYSFLAATLVALTPGLIQQAHFATPESNLIFFLFGSLLFTLKFTKTGNLWLLIISSVFLGLALGVKVSSAVMLILLMTGILLKTWPSIIKTLKFSLLSLASTLITFIIVAPFVFLDSKAFLDSFRYESNLATGQIPIFYTRQFIDTTPFIFQIEKILPFALGPALLVFGVVGFFLMGLFLFRHCHPGLDPGSMDSSLRGNDTPIHLYLVFLICFLVFFLTNVFLFAKWTRFLSPTFPFFAIFSAFLLFNISQLKISRFFSLLLVSCCLVLSALWTIAFFAIYVNPDIRFTASKYLENSTPPKSIFLVEGGNMIDLPLRGNFERISIDFYSLEDDILVRQKIALALEKSDYFLVQSRRVFFNHQRLLNIFPKTAGFYNHLFAGDLGFEEIKEFDSFPKISLPGFNIEFPDETIAEESWSVFDHPVIRVFKKVSPKPYDEYINILEN